MFDPPRRLSSALRHPKLDASSAADAEAAAAAAAESDMASEEDALQDGAADAPTASLWEMAGSGEDAVAEPDQPDAAAQPAVEVEAFETQAPADVTELPAGDAELELGRASLAAGDPEEAAVRLGIALRVAPALAPAVLDVVAGRTERSLVLVRGDAYRLVGHEIEAQRAYAEAARGSASPPTATDDEAAVPDPTDHPDDPHEGDPA
jgi:hypothetical protein